MSQHQHESLESLLFKLSNERAIAPITVNQYRRSVASFSEFLGHAATVVDLTVALVNSWLASIAGDYRPISLRGKKAGITAIWNYAAELRLADPYDSQRLRKIKVPRAPVDVWDLSDVGRLLDAAANMPGTLRKSGLPVAPLLVAYVRCNFETGLRQNDLEDLSRAQISDEGVIRIIQKKTGNPHICRISLETLSVIDSTAASGREKIWPLKHWGWVSWLRKLRKAAGLTKGISTLRKTHATQVCITNGVDAAAKSLGHVSGTATAERYYIGQFDEETPQPPTLPKTG